MNSLAGIMMLLAAALPPATRWDCRNTEFEIVCSAKKCRSATAFTPMHVTVEETGSISVCAYSGCWQGHGKVIKATRFKVFIGRKLAFSTSNTTQADFLIAIDSVDNVAIIKGAGYAMPMTCKTGAN